MPVRHPSEEDARRLLRAGVFSPSMPAAGNLHEIVRYCDERLGLPGHPDYPGALNGLQFENDGTVTRIGAAVDSGLDPFARARTAGVDFLIVHHGMFWDPPIPFTGLNRRRLSLLLEANLAVYGAHLPLDAHPELGNNALLARRLGLEVARSFLPFEGRDVGVITHRAPDRPELARRLRALFPRVVAIEHGAAEPRAVAIVSGAGHSAVGALRAAGVDTLVTGELREHCFTAAVELGLNLYACGHYATEVFGVQALAEEVATRFALPWEFLGTDNPL